jgi:hypothetical protein
MEQHRFRAQLVGGAAGGEIVRMDRIERRIAIWQNGGAPFVAPTEEAAPSDVTELGLYELVGPIGPEMPTYVAIASPPANQAR